MQIIPGQSSPLSYLPLDMFQASYSTGKSTTLFADLLKPDTSGLVNTSLPEAGMSAASQISSAVQNPQVVSAKAVQLADPAMPSDRASESMSSVKMTQADLDKLKEKLEAAGVSKEKIDDLDKKVQSPDGLTWGQMLHAVHQNVLENATKPVNLTEDDKTAISSLLSKLGFDTRQAAELTGDLAAGKGGKVLNAISAKLRAMDPRDSITLDKDEAAALGKALKLPAEAQQKLMEQFASQDSLSLTAGDAKHLFGAIRGEYAGVQAQAAGAMKAIHDAVKPVMAQAQESQGIVQQGLETKAQADQLKTAPLVKDAPDQNSAQTQSHTQAKNGQGTGTGTGSGNQPDPGQVQKDPRQRGSGNQEFNGTQDGKGTPERAWSEFVSKVRMESDTQLSSDGRLMAGTGLAGQSATLGQVLAKTTGDPAAAKAQASDFLDQVQSGLLKNMGQGVKQLTLELTPDNLGKLNVVLSVKGKEVQAVIKAESPEAEKLLADNLQQIKQSLENQGLTVSKLEVRTGLSQDSNLGQQWAGADKHNLSQERRDALERMRASSILSGDGGGLAQQMQSQGVAVKNSQGGLDIIA